MRYSHITELIGNTPLLEIDPKVHGLKNVDLYAKLEYFNPFGSVKDRIAWGMIKDDMPRLMKESRMLIEASSGNTAKALQVLASIHGLKFKTFTNRAKVVEVKDVLKLLGAEIEEFPDIGECLDPTIPNNVFDVMKQLMAKEPKRYYHASQYTNEKNIETHYRTTGKEIFEDVGAIDFFIGGLGTSGSTRGAAMLLKEKNPKLKTIGIVSSKKDFIPGIRSEKEIWEVGLFQKDFYDEIMAVDSAEAIDATMELVKKSGILAGPTSGAAYAGALQYLRQIDRKLTARRKAVFIACDRIEWYVSYLKKRRPDLFGEKTALPRRTNTRVTLAASMDVNEAEKWIRAERPLVVDIRSEDAYQAGHISGAINIPDAQLESMLNRGIPFSPQTELLLVCYVGKTSREVSQFLRSRGYFSSNLVGGMAAWRAHGKPTTEVGKNK